MEAYLYTSFVEVVMSENIHNIFADTKTTLELARLTIHMYHFLYILLAVVHCFVQFISPENFHYTQLKCSSCNLCDLNNKGSYSTVKKGVLVSVSTPLFRTEQPILLHVFDCDKFSI